MRPKLLIYRLILAVMLLALAACGPAATTAAPTQVPPTATTVPPTVPPTASPPPTAVPPTKVPPTAVPPTATPTPLPPTAVPPTVTPTPRPPTATPEAGLHVVSFTTYTDSSKFFHVAGEIKNSDKKILSEMELTIVIKDAAGKTLLKDNNDKAADSVTFSPMLSNLAPGESSPFDYSIDANDVKPDPKSVSVEVTGQHTSSITRAAVKIQHAQMAASGSDTFEVSGEIVNQSDKPVEIRDLAAALLDSKGKVLSADYSMEYAIYLLPTGNADHRDITPFYLSIPNPGAKPANYKTYLDAEEVQPADTYPVEVALTNNYFDTNDNFHIVGTATNKSDKTLTIQLVAGLYDKDGVVLDAYSISSPVNLAPGEVMPYNISTFNNVNYNAEAAKRLDHFTVQVDDYFTFPSAIETVALKSSGDKVTKDDSAKEWTVTGKVTNTSSKSLSGEIVMVQIFDAKGKLVAVDYTWISPTGDSIAAGETGSYSVTVPLSPNADTTGYTFKTLVKGEVK
jgi:hypothetical protein